MPRHKRAPLLFLPLRLSLLDQQTLASAIKMNAFMLTYYIYNAVIIAEAFSVQKVLSKISG